MFGALRTRAAPADDGEERRLDRPEVRPGLGAHDGGDGADHGRPPGGRQVAHLDAEAHGEDGSNIKCPNRGGLNGQMSTRQPEY